MDFENVNVISLKNAITSCLSKISCQEDKNILNEINPSNVWDCSSKSNLTNSMENMINVDYPKIIKGLQKLQEAADKIEKYKEIVQKIKEIDSQIKILNSNRYITYTDYRGITIKKLDTSVSSQISSLRSQRTSLNNQKINLRNEINRIISEI